MKRIKALLSGPALLNYTLPILILYLIAGTISQKYIGLYDSTKMFFSSAFFWLGPIPLPGVPIILGLIFINLSFKLFFKSPWSLKTAGTIVTHIGVLFLLLGGLFTALFSDEGYIALEERQSRNYVTDYHIREFSLRDENGQNIFSFNHKDLETGKAISLPYTNIKIIPQTVCRHCNIEHREPSSTEEVYHGMAQHMQLENATVLHNDEENIAGLSFKLEGSGEETDGIHVVIEDIPKLPEIKVDEKSYTFALGRQKRALPFEVELLEFKRDMHAGTDMAKAYSSRVRIIDGDARWESMISMNQPLRYKGYTLFQASFLTTESGDISVLTSVWNAGRAFPYISGITMCLGMIIHLGFRRRKKALKTASANFPTKNKKTNTPSKKEEIKNAA